MNLNSNSNIDETIYDILRLNHFQKAIEDKFIGYLTNYKYNLDYVTYSDHDMTETMEIVFSPRNAEENELFRHADGYEDDEERDRDCDLVVFVKFEMDWDFDKFTVYATSNYVNDKGHEVGVIMFKDLVSYVLNMGLSEEKTTEIETILKTAIDDTVNAAIAHASENTKQSDA